jgi:tetratricopeptide (TPR) repeat protein
MKNMERKVPKIAWCFIVKGDDQEAKLLNRAIENIHEYVDAIYVTITHKKGEKRNEECEWACRENGGEDCGIFISDFEWCNDFSKARNFNFSQVAKEYDYIGWSDCDDLFRGLEKLKPTIEENPTIDAFAMWYLYEFDSEKMPTVVHKKTMVVRNDSCSEWKGALHEDLCETRSISVKLIEGIDRMHFPGDNHQAEVAKRNVEISAKEAETNSSDPRVYFNLGNSYLGDAQWENSKVALTKFMELSQSNDEKYIALMRLSAIEDKLGNTQKAIQDMQQAIGMNPTCSDAYLKLGELYFGHDDMDNAEHYLLNGIIKKPPYNTIVVFNPRDYDYNPMQLLAKVYFRKNRPDLALPMLKGCLQIYPNNKMLKGYVKEMESESKRLEKVLKLVAKLDKLTDKEKISKELAKVPKDLQSHPAICQIRNKWFIKETSSGKDIAYYCGMTTHEWNPEMAKTKGVGGSEEAVMNLSKEWAKKGYNVTVYNSCGIDKMECDGVTYKPFWEFNIKDKQDVLIIWRHPKLLDYDLNASKVFVDVHDVIPKGEFNEKRLEKITKILVKTNFHRSLFPNVPDDKIAIVPNGTDFELFNQDVKKDPMLLVNTSSPDRSMDVLPELFMRVKKEVPKARLAWCYGWEIFDNSFHENQQMMEWKRNIQKQMQEAGIEDLGRLSQKDCAKLYLEGSILAYPSEFAEIDCISVKKAQACGCMPITTDFGALEESVQYGIKVHSNKTKDTWARPGKWSYGIEDEEAKQAWVRAVVKQLKSDNYPDGKEWAKKFSWDKISLQWVFMF